MLEDFTMQKLVLLYWGTIFLMYLSEVNYPCDKRVLGCQIGKRHFLRRKSDVFMVIVIAWMTCFSFLRTSYNDTAIYIMSFRNAQSIAEGIANGSFTDWTGNPWSVLYRSIIRELTDNYHIYFFFPALLSSFAIVKLCKRYSVNPSLSLTIFFSLGTYTMYIAALKQSIAIFFLLWAIPYAVEKKYVKFYVLLLMAVMIHAHAFMFAIVPLLFDKPWGRKTWILLAATLFAMATYHSTFGKFMTYAQSIGLLVAEIELFDNHSINILRVMVYWVPALMALFFRERLFYNSTRTENLFVNMSIVSAFILTIGLVQGANLYARMAAYFEVATIIALPWMINGVFNNRSAKFVSTSAYILYFIYFFYENAINRGFEYDYNAITLWQFIQSLFG